MTIELHTYADVQAQVKQIQFLAEKWKSFDEKTYALIQHAADNLLHFIRSENVGFQSFTKEQQFGISTSQYELDAILTDCNSHNFSDKIQLLKAMLKDYTSNLDLYSLTDSHFSEKLLKAITELCENIQYGDEISLSELNYLKHSIHDLVVKSMTIEFSSIHHREEIGNFIDQMDRFWSEKMDCVWHDKINVLENYKRLHPTILEKAEKFLHFLKTDTHFNKAA